MVPRRRAPPARSGGQDPRFGFGETILTVWPPPSNFTGINAVTRVIHVDDDGDGRGDRTVTVPMPIFHVLGLLSDLGDRYWALPERRIGGHVVSGFASRDARGVVRVLLYSHHAKIPNRVRTPRSTQRSTSVASMATLRSGSVNIASIGTITRHSDWPASSATGRLRFAGTDPATGGRHAGPRRERPQCPAEGPRGSIQPRHLGPASPRAAILKLAGQDKDLEACERQPKKLSRASSLRPPIGALTRSNY